MELNITKLRAKNEEKLKEILTSMNLIANINTKMDSTVSLMLKAGASSKQITELIEIMSDITEDTNVLALNATLQAAKAGESGKPFKLVADSIQGLAENAGDAAKRVGNLLSIVQSNISAANLQITETNKDVEETLFNTNKSILEIENLSKSNILLIEIILEMIKNESIRKNINQELGARIKNVIEKL